MTLLLLNLFVALAAFGFSVTGFGFALVAVPLLSLIMPLKEAVVLQFPLMIAVVCYHTWKFGRLQSWREIMPMVLAACVCMPLGLLTLNSLPDLVMKRGLSVCVALFVLTDFVHLENYAERLARVPGVSILMGLVGGWFQGAYTTGGPPAVIYIMATRPDPAKAKGLLSIYQFCISFFNLALYLWGGLLSWSSLAKTGTLLPAAILGILTGTAVSLRMGGRGHRFAVDFMLIMTALALWVKA